MNFEHSRFYTLDLDEIYLCIECIESYIGEFYGIVAAMANTWG